MAQQTDIALKAYFETGDTPTEAQYIDLIDSKRNAADEIPQTDVEKLAPLTVAIAASGSQLVPIDSFMTDIALIPTAGGAYTIGSTPGGSEYDSGALTGTTPFLFEYKEYMSAAKTIYFTGTFTAKIYTR